MGVPIGAFFLDNIGRCGHALCGDFAINFVDGGLKDVRAGRSVVYCGQSNLGLFENIALCPPVTSRQATAILPTTKSIRELESEHA